MAVNQLRLSSVGAKGLEMMREDEEGPGKERLQCCVSGITKNGCRFLIVAQMLGRILSFLKITSKKAQSSKEPIEEKAFT